MATFKRKPNEIEAIRWELGTPAPAGVCERCPLHNEPAIHTDHGVMRVAPGEWIITAADGRQWPNDHEYFEANYEAVEQKRTAPKGGHSGKEKNEGKKGR